MKKRLAIIGSLDLAQLMAHHAITSGLYSEIAGFFDDFRAIGEPTAHGPTLGPLSRVLEAYRQNEFDQMIVGIGYRHLKFREACFQNFRGQVPMGRILSSGCVVDLSAEIGEGSFLLPGTTLDKGVRVGPNCVLNAGVTIAHDSQVQPTCFLGPGVTLSGFVHIGDRCFLGTGTIVVDSVNIAPDIQTGAGAVVTSDLQTSGLYLGVPARLHRPF
jgi:sugar O-acyltransferase (sialic acid O-acetyltransferase NeuD family)